MQRPVGEYRQREATETSATAIRDNHISRSKSSATRLRVGSSRCSLFIQHRLAHDRILASHPSAESAFHLRTKGQLVQVLCLFCCGHKALRLKRLILETLQTIAEVGDICDSRVSVGQTACRALGGGERGAATDGGESLGVSVLRE